MSCTLPLPLACRTAPLVRRALAPGLGPSRGDVLPCALLVELPCIVYYNTIKQTEGRDVGA